jgi:transmembrane sensor
MTKNNEDIEAVPQLQTALEWLLRLRDPGADESDIAEWLAWYEGAESHKHAFAEAEQLWRQAGRVVDGSKGVSVAKLLGRAKHRNFLPRYWLGVAAGVVGIALVMSAALLMPQALTLSHGDVASVPPVPVRETVLPDGSQVQLAAKSDIDVQYDARQRALELKNGEAYFTVAPNPSKPFIVKIGSMAVRAVGTAFDIRRSGARVVVTVANGVVDVVTSGSATAERVRLAAGNQVTWTGTKLETSTSLIDPNLVLGWRRGQLQYIHEPLAAVISDINRYRTHPIVIRDEAIGELAFTGTVFVGSLNDWINALSEEFPLDVLTDNHGNTVLVGRSSAAAE